MDASNPGINSSGLSASEWIDIAAILVNIALGLWIAVSLQNSANNKRLLKDHFIGEIKKLSADYTDFFNKIETMTPNQFLPWFKSMNVKIGDVSIFIIDKYKIGPNTFDPYLIELNNLITNNNDFITQFGSNRPMVFSQASKLAILRFQQRHSMLFNTIIVAINDH